MQWSVGGFGTSWFYVEGRDGLIAFCHSGPEGGRSGEDFTEEFRIVNRTLDEMGWIMADTR